MKHNFKDYLGERFGRWTAVEYMGLKRWRCRCDCGNEGIIPTERLRRGTSQSCGCLQRELIAQRNYKHGMVKHPAYQSWDAAKHRCTDPKRRYYGGRGIKMHDAWLDFDAFWTDMGPTWKPGLSIDRINSNGDYEPGNCRWSTKKEQSNNRSSCVMIMTPQGKMNITEAAEIYGVNRWTIAGRIRLGWPERRLLEKPTK